MPSAAGAVRSTLRSPIVKGPAKPIELEDAALTIAGHAELHWIDAAPSERGEELKDLAHSLARNDPVEADDLGFACLRLEVGTSFSAGLLRLRHRPNRRATRTCSTRLALQGSISARSRTESAGFFSLALFARRRPRLRML